MQGGDDLQRQIEQSAKARIEALGLEIKSKQDEQRRLIAELQCSCSHSEIVEMPFRDSTVLSNAEPSARVCTTCGLAEGGWSCGHQLLRLGDQEYTTRLRRVSREEFYALRRGPIWENHEFVVSGRKPMEILREKLGVVE